MGDLAMSRWHVPAPGFEWMKSPSGNPDESVLTVNGIAPCAWRPYDPLSISGLFLEFTHTPPTLDGILAFANKYGALSFDANRQTPMTQAVSKPTGEMNIFIRTRGETFSDWLREIARAREVAMLWSALKQGDPGYLAEVISWDRDAIRYSQPHLDLQTRLAAGPINVLGERFVIANSDNDSLFAKFERGDTVGPGWHALQRLVNRQLESYTCETRMIWDRRSNPARLRMQLKPTSLLATFWLQFVSAIEGEYKYRQCDQCRGWFAPAQDTRSDARFCKVACRLKAYRLRQNKARELSTEGKTLNQIAAALNSDIKTVKGWLKK